MAVPRRAVRQSRTPRHRGESTLKAPPTEQQRLLDVQELDARLDRLAHRRGSLPELDQIKQLESERDNAANQLVVAQTRVKDLIRQQSKADADVEQVKSRRERNQSRLDAGQVSSPKELESLQHEIQTLDQRISTLEDEELEVMERLEQAQGEVDELERTAGERESSLAEVVQRRDAAYAEIDAEAESIRAEREPLAAEVSDELLRLYEKLRSSHGGVGAAALSRGRCGGCQLEINPGELSAITNAPEDEVLRCEECSRILVRTPRSGI